MDRLVSCYEKGHLIYWLRFANWLSRVQIFTKTSREGFNLGSSSSVCMLLQPMPRAIFRVFADVCVIFSARVAVSKPSVWICMLCVLFCSDWSWVRLIWMYWDELDGWLRILPLGLSRSECQGFAAAKAPSALMSLNLMWFISLRFSQFVEGPIVIGTICLVYG